MAAPSQILKILILGTIFYTSVLIWSLYGIFILAIGIIKSPWSVLHSKKRTTVPSVCKDSALGVHGFLQCKSQRLRIKYVANGDRSKPLMLCIHGFPECWYSWRYQLKEFSDKYWVVAIDLPGYGESDKPADAAFYSLSNYVDLFPDIINGLGYEKATIVAHDGGGVMIWRFIAQYADMCEKVIIMNGPNARGFMKGLSFNFKQYCYSWYIFFYQLPWLPEISMEVNDVIDEMLVSGKMKLVNQNMLTKDDVDVYKYYLSQWDTRRAFANFYRTNNLMAGIRNPQRASSDHKIRSPVLYIWGVEDGALSLDVARASAEISDLVRLEFLENASHWVQQDRPDEVNRLMREFLS